LGAKCVLNPPRYEVSRFHHVLVAEAQHAEACGFEPRRALRVALAMLVVDPAIHFDAQLFRLFVDLVAT